MVLGKKTLSLMCETFFSSFCFVFNRTKREEISPLASSSSSLSSSFIFRILFLALPKVSFDINPMKDVVPAVFVQYD